MVNTRGGLARGPRFGSQWDGIRLLLIVLMNNKKDAISLSLLLSSLFWLRKLNLYNAYS